MIPKQPNYVPEQRSKLFIGKQNYLAPRKVKFTMTGIQLNSTKPGKKQENMTQKVE